MRLPRDSRKISTMVKVTDRRYLYFKPQRGSMSETEVYELTLECGHNVRRTSSNAFVNKVRCRECAELTAE